MDELADEALCLSLVHYSTFSVRGAIFTDGLNCRSYFANVLSFVQILWVDPNEEEEVISISRPILFRNWLGLHRLCIQELHLTYPAEWITVSHTHQCEWLEVVTQDVDFILAEVCTERNNSFILKMFVSEIEFLSDMAAAVEVDTSVDSYYLLILFLAIINRI